MQENEPIIDFDFNELLVGAYKETASFLDEKEAEILNSLSTKRMESTMSSIIASGDELESLYEMLDALSHPKRVFLHQFYCCFLTRLQLTTTELTQFEDLLVAPYYHIAVAIDNIESKTTSAFIYSILENVSDNISKFVILSLFVIDAIKYPVKQTNAT